MSYVLKIVTNGQVQYQTIDQQMLNIAAQPDSQYQLLDLQGNVIPTNEQIVNGDLQLTLAGSEQPVAVVQNYTQYVASAASSASAAETAALTSASVTASEVGIGNVLLWGGAIAGVGGGVALAAGGGGGDKGGSAPAAPAAKVEEPKAPEIQEVAEVSSNPPIVDLPISPISKPSEPPVTDKIIAEPSKPSVKEAVSPNPPIVDLPTSQIEKVSPNPPIVDLPTSQIEKVSPEPPVVDKPIATIPATPTEETPARQTPTIRFNKITDDNIINLKESQLPAVEISGTVEHWQTGDQLRVTIGNVEQIVALNNGKFTLTVMGSTLAAHQYLQAEVVNATGNKVGDFARHDYRVDTEIAQPSLTLDTIAGDNIVNRQEAAGKIVISGSAQNVPDGKQVVIACGCAACQLWSERVGTVQNGRFSVEFDGHELTFNDRNQIRAKVIVQDDAGNQAEATAEKSYQIDQTAPQAVLQLNEFGTSYKINRHTADKVTISGSFNALNEGETASVQIKIGELSHTAQVSGNQFSLELDKASFANQSQLIAELEVRDNAQNVTKHTVSQPYQYDVELTTPTLTIDPIHNGTVIKEAEKHNNLVLSGTFSRDADVPLNNVQVVVKLNGHPHTATVTEDNRWSLTLSGDQATAQQETNHVNVEISVTDHNGNRATHSQEATYQVDTIAPELGIFFADITPDNVIDPTERSQQITIFGRVEGGEQNKNLVLMLADQRLETTLQENGHFSVQVSGEQLATATTKTVTAIYQAEDLAGNSHRVQTDKTYLVSENEQPLAIQLNPVTSDNLINVTEATGEVEVTGRVLGKGAAANQAVTISLNNVSYSATTDEQLNFKVKVKGSDLINDADHTISANYQNVTASQHYLLQDHNVARIVLDPIADGALVSSPMVSIEGSLTLPSIFTERRGYNKDRLRGVTLNIGDKHYHAGLDRQTMKFKVDIPKADLASLKGQKISHEINADLLLYRLKFGNYSDRVSVETDYVNNHKGGIRVTLSGNNVVMKNGSYHLENVQPELVTVTGKAIGAKAGDRVILHFGEKPVETTVNNVDNEMRFSVDVDKQLLMANRNVKAELKTTNGRGQAISAFDHQDYSVAPEVRGDFVAPSAVKVHPSYLYSSPIVNYEELPYFIKALTGNGKQVYRLHQAPIDATTTPVFKYYVDYNYSDADKAAVKSALDKISYYANINFESTTAQDWTAAISFSMKPMVAEGITEYLGGKKIDINSKYRGNIANSAMGTVLHETLHALGANHPFRGARDFNSAPLPGEEDTMFLTVMSYTSENGYENSLNIYDLAFLHYRFGVNAKSRAGNDIYRFKQVNPHTAEKDVYIWDGAGVDTFDASDQTQGVTVDLTPGSWNYVGTERAKHLVALSREEINRSTYLNYDERNFNHSSYYSGYIREPHYQFSKGQSFIGFGTVIEKLIGSAHNDILTGNDTDNVIYGGSGEDTIKGGKGNDYLDGGIGQDNLHGNLGDDIFVVNDAADKVFEILNEGSDTVHSYIDYTLSENVENLQLFGTAKTAQGNELANRLIGNGQDNQLTGQAGDDRLEGRAGNDTLTGGEGKDTFVFNTALDGSIDTVADFNVSDDKIELSSTIFNAVQQGSALTHIQYDKATGQLSYDPDAQGVANAIHFANLNKDLTLTESHFILA